jgi:DNA-binding NtrC family response regulator
MSARTVLLIDDEENLRWALSSWLTGRGLQVATAASGEEALGLLDDDPGIAVAVLDVKMPGLTGIETLRAIKARYPRVEALVVTGYPTVEYALEAKDLGALEYLAKPCDIHVLYQAVQQALDRAARRAGAFDGADSDACREARA